MTSLLLFSEQPLVHAVGWALLHFCWQATIVAIILAYAMRLLSGRSPQHRYLACCFALMFMAVLPFVTFGYLAANQQAIGHAIATSTMERYPSLSLLNGFTGMSEPWADRIAGTLDQSMPWLLLVWFTGVILLFSRFNIRLIVARRMKSAATQPASLELQRIFFQLCHRLGIARTVKLMDSGPVQVPTVIGWLRPVVLIPVGCLMGLSPIQVEALLAHELAHIRRHDYLVNVCQSVVETLLFYHPAVWWVSKQLRREREYCCDDLAVRISGDPLAYAKALSFLEERRSSQPMFALGANGGALALRIRRLLGCEKSPAVSQLTALTLSVIVIAGIGLYIGTVARAQSATGKQIAMESNQGGQAMPALYRQWMDEDVLWIITPEERAAYLQLSTDKERDNFIKQFWEVRNPTPGAVPNKFREEHYRRIAYSNRHFAIATIPGWRTDRGRIYIVYGPPDAIDTEPNQGRGSSARHVQVWHYRLIQQYGPPNSAQGKPGYQRAIVTRKNVAMKFVDVCNCGDYQLQQSPKR
jgi:GWxTD domain-containing protein